MSGSSTFGGGVTGNKTGEKSTMLEMVCLEKVCYPLIVWFVRVRIIIIDLCVFEENNRTLGKNTLLFEEIQTFTNKYDL